MHRAFSRLTGRVDAERPRLLMPRQLEEIALHLSESERVSAAAENEAEQQMLMLYMERQCESPSPRVWDAVVTAVWGQGVAVEVPLLRLKGFISGSELPGAAAWYHERHANCWRSFSGASIKPGDTLRVVPVNTDLSTGFLDFRPA